MLPVKWLSYYITVMSLPSVAFCHLIDFESLLAFLLHLIHCTTGSHTSQEAHLSGAYMYLRFLLHEATRSSSTLPGKGCLSIPGIPPALNTPVPIYTPLIMELSAL